jgi:hypothetical protein
VWPSPRPATLEIDTGGCRLELPVRPPRREDAALPDFPPPEAAPATGWKPITKGGFRRSSEQDPATGERVSSMRSGWDGDGRVAIGRCDPIDMEGGDGTEIRTRIHDTDPLRARAAMAQRTELRRGGWSAAIETEIEISCTHDSFRVEARLSAEEGERPVFERRWDERVPREGV